MSFNAVPRACRQVRVHEPPGSWWLRLICVLADETDQWLHGQREKEAALLCRNDRLVDGVLCRNDRLVDGVLCRNDRLVDGVLCRNDRLVDGGEEGKL